MSQRNGRRVTSAAILCFLLIGSLPLWSQRPSSGKDDGVSEEITVLEVGVVLDFQDALSPRQIRRLRSDDIVVLEDGDPREVTNLRPLSLAQGDWKVLIYVDGPLSRPETVRLAAVALAQNAVELTRLGGVRIVLADPEPQEILAESHAPLLVEQTLLDLADGERAGDRLASLRTEYTDTLRENPDAISRLARKYLEDEVSLVRRQSDHLLRLAGEGCPAAPCVLFLVSDGFYLEPEVYYLGEAWAKAHPDTGSDAEAAGFELAQTLAAYEMITLVLPLRKQLSDEDTVAGPPGSEYDRWLEQVGGEGRREGGVKVYPRRRSTTTESSKDYALFLLPILEPLRKMAAQTSGATVRSSEQLALKIRELSNRWRLWYHTPRPTDGTVRALEVELAGSGRRVAAPFWIRSSTPEAVAAARIRRLLSGESASGQLSVTGRLEGRGTQASLALEVAWDTSPPHRSRTGVPLRISLGSREIGNAAKIRHQFLEAEIPPEASAWQYRLPLVPPEGAGRLVVSVEALIDNRWGAVVIEPR